MATKKELDLLKYQVKGLERVIKEEVMNIHRLIFNLIERNINLEYKFEQLEKKFNKFERILRAIGK